MKYKFKRVHICIGFYPNGSNIINHVADEDLKSNIEYNRQFRPGRYYFVDGEYVCGKSFSEPYHQEFIQQCLDKIQAMNLTEPPYAMRPYY